MRRVFPFLVAVVALTACNRNGPSDRLDDNQVAANETRRTPTGAATTPARRCASGRAYDLTKRELFRRAAVLRGRDDAIFDRLAAAAAIRVERPVLKSQDEGLGSIGCSATISLDLPPGLAVAGGRTSLTADLDYILQPAADGTGDVVVLTNADAITVPLATLGRTGSAEARPASPVVVPGPEPLNNADPARAPANSPPAPALPTVHRAPVRAAPDPLAPRPSATDPSFACARSRTRGEVAVCGDPALAALDRRMAAQYRDAYAAASSDARNTLRSSARHFYGFRDNCPDARCIADGYRARMREIDEIMRDDLAPR